MHTPTNQPIQLVILDRDGVINHDSPSYIKSPAEWQPIPGSIEAIAKLNHAGLSVGIATNQSGLARGYFDEATLHAMHDKMEVALGKLQASIPIIRYCPHLPNVGCNCRKPQPGMLQDIMQHTGLSAAQTIMVGDSLKDLQAAQAAGCQSALVRTGNGLETEKRISEHDNTSVHDHLSAFVEWLLSR